MFRDSLIAMIRTGVSALVGILLAFLVSKGVTLPADAEVQLTAAFVLLATALYNWAVNLLERYVDPRFGILLGVPKAPTYAQGQLLAPEPAIVATQPANELNRQDD